MIPLWEQGAWPMSVFVCYDARALAPDLLFCLAHSPFRWPYFWLRH